MGHDHNEPDGLNKPIFDKLWHMENKLKLPETDGRGLPKDRLETGKLLHQTLLLKNNLHYKGSCGREKRKIWKKMDK